LAARITALRAGQADARILCLGDSTTRGVNRDLAPGERLAHSYPSRLAPLLAARLGVKVTAAGFIGIGNMPDADARLHTSFGIARGGLGRSHYHATGPAGLSFAPGVTWDTAELHLIARLGTGFSCQAGEASPVLMEPATAKGPATLLFRTAPTSAPLHLAWAAGGVSLVGLACRLAAEREITILNAGIGGGQAADQLGEHPMHGPQRWISHLAPDLTIVDFGINEYLRGVAPAAYRASLEAIVATARRSGEVLLKTFIPCGRPGGGHPETAYLDHVRELAARQDIPLLDIHARWGTYAAGRAKGWYSDRWHGSVAGYLAVAEAVAEAVALLVTRS
jgi:lysophospholipase L1-like esterase